MTIDNHRGGENQFGASPASHAEAHSRIALEQSALFAARLAIARWSNTSSPDSASETTAPVMAQARWLADAQLSFQQWLQRGGFTQDRDDCADLAPTMYIVGGAQAPRTDIPSAAA